MTSFSYSFSPCLGSLTHQMMLRQNLHSEGTAQNRSQDEKGNQKNKNVRKYDDDDDDDTEEEQAENYWTIYRTLCRLSSALDDLRSLLLDTKDMIRYKADSPVGFLSKKHRLLCLPQEDTEKIYFSAKRKIENMLPLLRNFYISLSGEEEEILF